MKTRRLRPAVTTRKRQGAIWAAKTIVYICGITRMKFGPSDKGLGGSEQAVVQLSKCWSQQGYKVVVYGNVKECTQDGVEYKDIHKLNLADTFYYAIFWRSFGIRLLPLVKAKYKIVDLHDSWDPKNYVSPVELIGQTDLFMVKSKYHKDLYPYIPANKMRIVMNGVQVSLFETMIDKVSNKERDPHKFIYASTYERGLEPILKYSWPIIKSRVPDATIDIYYGMNRLAGTPLGKRLVELFKQDGVKEHGRVGLDIIAQKKALSGFHLYVSNSETEIDCISVRESLLCGAIPILGNDYVFKERDGIHITGSTKNADTYKRTGHTVVNLIKRGNEFLDDKRAELAKSKTIISWEEIAQKWIHAFESL
jgi:glycosyltransferase involved in cell wall biosynthesis